MTDRLMGVMVSNSPRNAYQACFSKRVTRRGVLGMPHYLPNRIEDKENNDTAAISYFTLNLGPTKGASGRPGTTFRQSGISENKIRAQPGA